MSKKATDHLHKLIKALSKPEKRYFKIYASRHQLGEQNNYAKLFDAIDAQSVYDEDAIKKKFKNENFVKKYSIAKNRLYETVLRSLDAYHANSSIDAQLKRLLHCAEIMYKKTLYDHSSKLLRSAKKLAYRYDKHTTLLEIFMWEKLLIERDNYQGVGEDELQEILEEDSLVLKKIQNYNDFWNIKSRLFQVLNRRGKARNDEEFKQFKTLIDDTLLKSEDSALYHETKYLYYHTYSAYYFGVGDYLNSYINLEKNVKLIESQPEKFKEEPNVYFSVLTNIIYIGSQLGRFDEVFTYLEKVRSIPEKLSLTSNEDLDIKLFSSAHSIELTVYAVMGEFEKGLDLIPIVEDGLKLYGNKINSLRKASFYFEIAYIYFGCGDMPSALKWTNRLMNDIDIGESEDIFCFGQLLNLVIHLEMGNAQLVPYAMKSTQRYLKTRNRRYKFETTMLTFLSRVTKIVDEWELPDAYERLHEELLELEQDQFEKTAFEYFDFAAWAESKHLCQPFVQVVKRRAKERAKHS